MGSIAELQASSVMPDALMYGPTQPPWAITDIVALEKPQSADKPLGPKALAWIKKNAPKAASGAWKIGSAIATDLLKEAALKYYGRRR
jgi:hypothetical protein